MMVVPAPRAIPLSFSESRPKTVRVESSTANTKPATANTPTITGRKYRSCPGMGLLLLQSGRGRRNRPPPPVSSTDCSGFTNPVEKINPWHHQQRHREATPEHNDMRLFH